MELPVHPVSPTGKRSAARVHVHKRAMRIASDRDLLFIILSVSMTRRLLFEFVWLPTFERTSKGLLSEEDRRAIEARLCANLEAGAIIRRTGGFRKLRHALEGGGKSGGARVIYFADQECERVYMILAYGKGAKETLTRAEENELSKLATQLENEEC